MDIEYKYHKATIREPVSFIGVGLHTGRTIQLSLKPSVDRRGIFFVRKDLPAPINIIEASWYNVSDTHLSTNLSNQYRVSVHTVEHLMSALYACGIDSVRIELDGPEIPIMDGSAVVFAQTIRNAGKSYLNAAREAIWIEQPVVVTEGDKYALLIPSTVPRVTACIDFPGTAIGSQCYSVELQGDNYFNEVAYARTFGFASQVEQLKRQGLIQGGSLINAILVDGQAVVNTEGLRIENEFVRHKILDAIGDMYLAGSPVMGHYFAYKAGHSLNQKLLQKLYSEQSSWSLLPLKEGERRFADREEKRIEEYFQQLESVG